MQTILLSSLFLRQVLSASLCLLLCACQSTGIVVERHNKVKPLDGLDNNKLFKRGDEGGESPIYVPESDKRKFRYIRLENDLPVILVSDPDATEAAAALSVAAGSRHDPEDFQGLAHFLEHMLFLGSENYPDAGAFNSYITEHGGYNNAFTSFEATQYFLKVRPDGLSESLARFADMFSAPLFDAVYVEKEIRAIDAEYSSKLRYDSRRIDEAEKSLLPAGHPRQKLTVGNHKTLRSNTEVEKTQLIKALRSFYNHYYSSSRMTLSVSSSQSLDELERYVSGFSGIKNNGSFLSTLNFPLIDANIKRRLNNYPLLAVEKLKPGRTLSLRFALGDLKNYIRNHSVDYVASILGDEGENSLLIKLKERDWVRSLNVGIAPMYEGYSELRVKFSLTPAGMENIASVTEHFYQAVAQIRSEITSVERRKHARSRFKEHKQITENAIRFMEPMGAVDTVLGIVNASRYFEPAEIVVGSALYEEFDAQAILSVVDQIVPDNSIALLASDQLPGQFELGKTSRWYHAKHDIFPLAKVCAGRTDCQEKLIVVAKNKDQLVYSGGDEDAYLPLPNNYLADNFLLRCEKDALSPCIDDRVAKEIDFEASIQHLGYNWGNVYWHTDRLFKQPRTEFYVQLLQSKDNQLNSIAGIDSRDLVRRHVLKSLYIRVIREVLRSKAYAASSAGLSYSIYGNRSGLVVSLDGYSQTLPRLTEDVFQAFDAEIIASEVNNSAFAVIKQSLLESYQRRLLATPNSRLGDQLSLMLLPDSHSVEQKIQVLSDIGFQDVISFAEEFLSEYQAEVLLAGNIALRDVKSYQKILCEHFRCQKPRQAKMNTEVRDITGVKKSIGSIGVSHSDHASLWYFQSPDDSIESTAATMLLSSVLRAPFFNELRTEQQLGYLVSLSYAPFYRRAGLSLSVQSADFSSDQIDNAIENWLKMLFSDSGLDAPLSEQAFNLHRTSLLDEISKPPKHSHEQVSRWWRTLQLGDYTFERRQKLVSAIEKLNYQRFVKFAQPMLAPYSERLVKLQALPEA